jgi:phosphopantothenoylcysteine decarboxylase / phosphopantothenate---cysteine ligase
MEDWTHLQDIEQALSCHLVGKLIGIGVSGSIACIEIHRLARTLIRHGAKVQFFLTPAASELVSPVALAWSTGREPILSLSSRCEHLEYFGENGLADLLLLAPATANTLSKVACGIDDNVVTTCVTTALGTDVPVLCAPGMHEPMMRNPAVRNNLERLTTYGIEILQPILSEGKQKMMGTDEMVARVMRRLGPGDLAGKRILITGGPTREFLDPARCLTNPSSGLTACLLAEEAFRRGGEVVLVYGPGTVSPASWLTVEKVISCADMTAVVERMMEQGSPDYCVAAAAVSDFKPTSITPQKRSTSSGGFELALEVTPKILNRFKLVAPGSIVVAFKAASSSSDEELMGAMAPYLESTGVDLVVGNSISQPGMGFDSFANRYLVARRGDSPVALGPALKSSLVGPLWDEILKPSRS